MSFDPDTANPQGGIFGLPFTRAEAKIHILAVPYAATCSYGTGAEHAPRAVLHASRQIDLVDPDFGEAWRHGIHLDIEGRRFSELHEEARILVRAKDAAKRQRVDALCRQRTQLVLGWSKASIEAGRAPIVLGGDHSCALGLLQAVAKRTPRLSILQIDAHMDLRAAYEGFRESHASIMWNVLHECPEVDKLVQVGIRDFSAGELAFAKQQGDRVHTIRMADWNRQLFTGTTFASLVDDAISVLSEHVHVSFDIDGLDAAYCPNTGTPVPGGLSFSQASFLLVRLRERGKRVVSADLCEISCGQAPVDEWDANVGARILYKLCALLGRV